MRLPQPGDFVRTSLGHGFIKERCGSIYLVEHGDCRFAFRADEITVLQTREDRQKNGPLKPRNMK
ncbi:hypothetical protein REC12_11315 [Desulfosporosinus sp. PR]|uniref:hypothetical protein n=1 Tax=Candidatus Desulfosporosinus nitrosoreducens TaxID=3401928 RepID=UPI0027F09F72|nr:hypothetical protein [Desulfosporosinus sp. PR]MDQ7094178.1 hypothetical protein [Desulfosporosinus sp. PR]